MADYLSRNAVAHPSDMEGDIYVVNDVENQVSRRCSCVSGKNDGVVNVVTNRGIFEKERVMAKKFKSEALKAAQLCDLYSRDIILYQASSCNCH